MNTEEQKEMDRLHEEIDRLTKMNVSLAAASVRLMARNDELERRLDVHITVSHDRQTCHLPERPQKTGLVLCRLAIAPHQIIKQFISYEIV